MKKVILAASLIAGIIAISACTKVNPVTEAINNNAQVELAQNGGGHCDSLHFCDSINHHCDTMFCDTTGHGHHHGNGGCGGGGCCGGDTINGGGGNGGGNGGHGGGGGHGHGGHGGGC